MLLKDAAREYLDAKRIEGYSPHTLEGSTGRLKLLARYLRKRSIDRVTDVRPQHLDDYAASLVRRGAKVRTRIGYMATTQVFFRWLYEQGKLLTDPARDIIIPQRDEEPLPEPPLTEEQVSWIIDNMPRRDVVDLRNKLHLELLYSCGLRITESLELRLGDIDMENRSIRILGKGGKVRVLPLMRGSMGALKDYLALRRTLVRGPDNGVLLLAQFTGRQLSESTLYPHLRKIGKRLRLKIHPHLFRHSIAVHLLQRGADIRHVQEFLGHASIDTTKIYLRLVPAHLREDYDKSMPEIAVKV